MTLATPGAATSTEAVVQVARRNGIHLRELAASAETVRGSQLLQDVWGGPETVGPANWLRTVQKTGGYLFGAYDDSGVLLGVSVGLLSTHGLHSHITGVAAAGQRHGIGLALKQHQRAWCLDRGITTVTWTCDPLVRRNVAFNLHALGAAVDDYVPDYYGPMADGVNADDETDRFSFRWDLLSPAARAAQEGRLPWRVSDAPYAVSATGSVPLVHAVPGAERLVQLPEDVERLRRTEPEAARAWRSAVRDAVVPALAAGASVTGLTADGALVLEGGA
jgi:predicted GNAT superfamily acetyltransferase